MTVSYLVGDSRTVTATLPDGSVDLVASSPPFLALRSYLPAGHESKGDEIGSEANPAAFLDTLLGLTAEWGRVLAPHGSLAIELGDTYSGSGGGDAALSYRMALNGERDKGGKTESRDPAGWPLPKSLALIPQLYAVALAYDINPLTGQPSPAGRWRVRNVIVWHRPNPAVGALGDKVRPSTSYIVVATRSSKRWFDLTAVRETPKPHSLKYDAARKLSPGTGYQVDTRGDGGRITGDMNPAGAPPLDCWFDSEPADAGPFDEYDGSHDTWTLTTQPSSLAHYAMWPAKLAERLILMMCPREVCRVCGEPRRRVEAASYIGSKSGRPYAADNWASGNGTNHAHANKRPDERATLQPETLGWTDCQCLSAEMTAHLAKCPVEAAGHYVDARPFRPGLVLDPFAGTGSTLCVAELHGRDSIGIDIDPRNRDLMPRRMDEVKRALFGTPAPMPGQMAMVL